MFMFARDQVQYYECLVETRTEYVYRSASIYFLFLYINAIICFIVLTLSK